MNEREKEILKNIGNALPHMSEFDKGYLLGVAEANVNKQKEKENASSHEAELVQQ